MRTGMNLLLWTTHVTAEHFPTIGKLKEAGFDGVELPLFDGDAAHYRTIAAELKKQGLGCTTVTVVGPDANPISRLVTATRGLMDGTATAAQLAWVLAASAVLAALFAPLTTWLYRRRA